MKTPPLNLTINHSRFRRAHFTTICKNALLPATEFLKHALMLLQQAQLPTEQAEAAHKLAYSIAEKTA